ncbi:DUF2339 domain-containing protein [Priestia megaterium]|nr:DUF2339 domain-containing protein [Priestia megaterium]
MENERISELEKKVQNLEREVALLSEIVKNPSMLATPQVSLATSKREKVNQPLLKERQESSVTKKAERVDWEKVLFQTWLPRIFIFVFIIGVLWGFKAASDYGLMNEPLKVTLGYVVSVAFAIIGHFQVKQSRFVLGQVLVGGSIPLFMLTTFAMHHLYGMVNPVFAFVLNVLWISLAIAAAIYYKSQALSIISVIGGVLIPFLLESKAPNAFLFVGYETLLYLAFIVVAVKQKYNILYALSACLLNVALLIFYSFANLGELGYLLGTAIFIQHICLIAVLFLSETSISTFAFTALTSLFVTYGWLLITMTEPAVTILLIILAASYMLGIYLLRGHKEKFEFFITYTLVTVTFILNQFMDKSDGIVLFLVQGTAAYYVALTYRNMIHKIIAYALYTISALIVVLTPINTFFSIETFDWLGVLLTFIAVVYISIKKEEEEFHRFYLTGGSILFTVLMLIFITQVTNVLTASYSANTQTLALTFAWIVLALIALVIGSIKSFKTATYIGISLLFLTLVKLVLYDLPFIPVAIRAILFIALGAIGLIVSRLFYKKHK